MLGLPTAWLALRALTRADDAAVAIFAVLAIAAVAGFTKAEVERIWMFFVPFVCVAAAGALKERRLQTVLGLLAVHALAWELAWGTIW
jgi:methylthioxylose transferase